MGACGASCIDMGCVFSSQCMLGVDGAKMGLAWRLLVVAVWRYLMGIMILPFMRQPIFFHMANSSRVYAWFSCSKKSSAFVFLPSYIYAAHVEAWMCGSLGYMATFSMHALHGCVCGCCKFISRECKFSFYILRWRIACTGEVLYFAIYGFSYNKLHY